MTDGICFQVKQNSGMSHPLGSDGRGGRVEGGGGIKMDHKFPAYYLLPLLFLNENTNAFKNKYIFCM